MKLKSKEDYIKASGWSSSLFLDKALQLFNDCDRLGIEIKIKRTVIYLNSKLNLYVHHNGRSREYLTICSKNGKELGTFHFQQRYSEIFSFIQQHLSLEK